MTADGAGMGVQELSSQSARTDTGVTLAGIDRETLRASYQGRSMLLAVEDGLGSYGVYLPRVPTWNDGDPVAEEDLSVIKDAVVEILRYWGFGTEFITLRRA
jgi:hypothetical protein